MSQKIRPIPEPIATPPARQPGDIVETLSTTNPPTTRMPPGMHWVKIGEGVSSSGKKTNVYELQAPGPKPIPEPVSTAPRPTKKVGDRLEVLRGHLPDASLTPPGTMWVKIGSGLSGSGKATDILELRPTSTVDSGDFGSEPDGAARSSIGASVPDGVAPRHGGTSVPDGLALPG